MHKEILLPVFMVRQKDVVGIPLVKWTQIAMLKQMGGWGVKNIFCFTKALVAKIL
jgi:hypothetical protein